MTRRNELHEKFCDLLGSRNVYFQPPESVRLVYPCIIYRLGNFNVKHADDITYLGTRRYIVTLVSKDPDSPFVDELLKWKLCSFDRFFTADNLNHWTFELYY